MASKASIHPTLAELFQGVNELGYRGRGSNKRQALDGLKPRTLQRREGTQLITPEQMLHIRVAVQHVVDGKIVGYQRHLEIARARKFARKLLKNPNYLKETPVIELSLDGGQVYITDGQHRLAGGILARKPLEVRIVKRTEEEARNMFASQGEGRRPPANNLIFSSSGAYEEYIQDAVTSSTHPWSGLISSAQKTGGGTNRISAASARSMLRIFVGRTTHNQSPSDVVTERFNREQADLLATLLSTFGTRQSNPLAFSASALRAIAYVGRYVFIEREPNSGDVDRWVRHMSRFPWQQYAYVRGQREWADRLAKYWNRQLSEDRKVRLPD